MIELSAGLRDIWVIILLIGLKTEDLSRAGAGALGAPFSAPFKAAILVIVNQSRCLHMRIHNSGAHEAKSPFLKIP